MAVNNFHRDEVAGQGRVVSVGEASEMLGVSAQTVRNWIQAGVLDASRTFGNHRRVCVRSIRRWNGEDEEQQEEKQTICYARVSTQAQKKEGNLSRQENRLVEYCQKEFQNSRENILVISESGSGLNETRRGYLKLIDLILGGKIERIVVEHRDRIARFGTKVFTVLCERMNVDLVVTNAKSDISHEEELSADVLSIITVFSAKVNGRRGGEESRMVLTDAVKTRIIQLYQQGLAQTQITIIIREENFRCPKTNRKYAIHAVRQTIHQQEKILKALPVSTSPIEKFIQEKCIRAEGERVFTRPFSREYSIWCKAHNLPSVTSQNLTISLKRMFKLGRNGSGYSFINGIALKDYPRASRSHLG
jgi:putative resolvase